MPISNVFSLTNHNSTNEVGREEIIPLNADSPIPQFEKFYKRPDLREFRVRPNPSSGVCRSFLISYRTASSPKIVKVGMVDPFTWEVATAMNTVASVKQCVVSDLQSVHQKIQEIASLSIDRLEAVEDRVAENTDRINTLFANRADNSGTPSTHNSAQTSHPPSRRASPTPPNEILGSSINVLGLKIGSRIPIFSGAPAENFSTFVRSFMDHVKAVNPALEESSVRAVFLTYLTEFARDKAEELLEKHPSYTCQQLVEEMRKTFEDPNRAEMERQQLRQCSQRTDESVDDFCTRVRKLALSAHAGNSRDFIQEKAKEAFIDGLLFNLKFLVKGESPTNFQEAQNSAMKFELLLKEAARSNTIAPQGLAVIPAPAPAQNSPWSKPKRECFYCGIPGHFARECRRKIADQAKGIFQKTNKVSNLRSQTRSFPQRNPVDNHQIFSNNPGVQAIQPVVSTIHAQMEAMQTELEVRQNQINALIKRNDELTTNPGNHQVPNRRTMKKFLHCSHGDLVPFNGIYKTLNDHILTWPSAPFSAFLGTQTAESTNCVMMPTRVMTRFGKETPESPAGSMVGCRFSSGFCNTREGAAFQWTPNPKQECKYLELRTMKGFMTKNIWVSTEKEFAISFDQNNTRLLDCGRKLVISDQGYGIALPNRNKRSNSVDELTNFVTSNQLAAQLLAVEEVVLETTAAWFAGNFMSWCSSFNAVAAATRAAVASNPTLAARQMLKKENIFAKYIGNDVLSLQVCSPVPQDSYEFVPFTKTCYSKPALRVRLPKNTSIVTFVDLTTRVITNRAHPVDCSLVTSFQKYSGQSLQRNLGALQGSPAAITRIISSHGDPSSGPLSLDTIEEAVTFWTKAKWLWELIFYVWTILTNIVVTLIVGTAIIMILVSNVLTPYLPFRQPAQPQFERPQSPDGQVCDYVTLTERLRSPRINALAHPTEYFSAVVPLKANGINCWALIDTGASFTVAGQGILHLLGIPRLQEPLSYMAVGLGNNEVKMAGSAVVKFQIGSHVLFQNTHFTTGQCTPGGPRDYDFIIGNDAHYMVTDVELPSEPAQRISESTTLQMIQDFRNETTKWMTIDTPITSVPNGKRNPNVATLSRFDCDRIFALYIVKESAGGNLHLNPAHRELVSYDRPDLYTVHLTRHSEDILNPGPPNPANYYIGDLLVVLSLKRRPGAKLNEIKRDFVDILDMNKCHFWQVNKFALVQRKVEKDQPLWKMDDLKEPIDPRRKLKMPWKAECIGYNQNQVVEAKIALFKELHPQDQKCTAADILVPVLEPASTLRSLLPGDARHAVITATNVQPPIVPLKPTVTAVRVLPGKFRKYISIAPNAFKGAESDPDYDLGGKALLWTARFGLAATLAIANKGRDTTTYSTTITESETTGRRSTVTFTIRRPSTAAPVSSWTRSTAFKMDISPGGTCDLEVESATLINTQLTIRAKFTFESQSRINEKNLLNQNAVVWQQLDDNLHQLRTFPEPEDWLKVPVDSPSGNVLIALTGGPEIDGIMPWDKTDVVDFAGSAVKLSEEQSYYANTLAKTKIAGVIANAPPGVGKTLMVAGAAIHAIRETNDLRSIQTLTGMTNVSVLPMVKTLRTLDPETRYPPVRLISESHREHLDPALRTEIDYPILWIKVFKDLLHRIDPSTAVATIRENPDLMSAIQHLHAKKIDPEEFAHHFIRKAVAKGPNSDRNTTPKAELFRKLYNPRIVVGTVASVLESFKTPDWTWLRENVSAIQVDEASQLPLYALAALALMFQRARLALVGDIHQLPPFEDSDLPKDIAAFAISRVLQEAIKRRTLPIIDLTVGRRCPPQVTRMYNELFYNQRLTSLWSPEKEAELRAFTAALKFGNDFPIQILDLQSSHTQSGTSLTNIEEAKAAVRIARTIQTRVGTNDIGILCFYKAQAGEVAALLGDAPFYVGTIDGSQGHEFQAVIILTTRTSSFRDSEFIEDCRRINVAISRTKRICCIIVDRPKVTTNGTWSRLIRRIPHEAKSNFSVMTIKPPAPGMRQHHRPAAPPNAHRIDPDKYPPPPPFA
ncbi:Protein CBR-DCT-10 [Caenorhabditis briggsae]|uniref:Protein CBR-DCT-10 n=1 Tax=Caenorhabditis briggsae TaxID=6238 RepID=A8WL97_CAEBR|nr:Protein CBR-DCT-10 [Caenorhabditis briggsae]CAP21241.2 Protein CBR-DCT-10 [Caenorhabditis briggsae]